ncbi:MAG: ElyC/SanA/YdcF family protein [Verrucomicrobiales bacterium]|nr:ElyC/SanA/YdcF family protein [Verrucomicrobiales bacterium]
MDDSDIQLAEILWNYHRIFDKPVKSDVIIGLGSYDTRVAGHCARLLSEGWAPLIIFTGAEGNFTRGKWEKTEAETFADVAISAGVNPAKILAETLATNRRKRPVYPGTDRKSGPQNSICNRRLKTEYEPPGARHLSAALAGT